MISDPFLLAEQRRAHDEFQRYDHVEHTSTHDLNVFLPYWQRYA